MPPARLAARLLPLLLVAPAAAQLAPVFPGWHLPLVAPSFSLDEDYIVADVDLDGLPDVLSSGGGSLQVARGLPAGGFAPVVFYPLVGQVKLCMAVGALDGDGWPDVAAGTSQERVVVAHGAGGGVYGFSAEYFVGGGDPQDLALGDLNLDGLGDIVSATESTPGILNVTLADGTGGYLGALATTTAIEVQDLELADLDDDGVPDALLCDAQQDKLIVYRGAGTGGWLPPQTLPALDSPRDVIVAKLDGDADLDVLVLSAGPGGLSSGALQTFLGDGTGALQALPHTIVAGDPAGAALGDLDADGDLDVIARASGEDTFHVLHNDGTGAFATQQVVPLGQLGGSPELLDVTADGVPDLLGHSLQSLGALYPAKPDGSFHDSDRWLAANGQFRAIAVERVDFDDVPDVVFVGFGDLVLGTLRGAPGGLQPAPVMSPGFALSNDVAVGDVDGDSLPDAVLAANSPPRLLMGHGNGTGKFLPPTVTPWTSDATAHTLDLADLDGDGWRDVVASVSDDQDTLLTFRNLSAQSPGSFDAPVRYPAGQYARAAFVGDVDNDGDADVLLMVAGELQQPDSSLETWLGDGAGNLVPGPVTTFASIPSDLFGLAAADLDLDGLLDVAVGREGSWIGDELALAYGDGTGGFVPEAVLQSEVSVEILVTGDVDGDGWPDLLHGGHSIWSWVALRRNDGAGGLAAAETFAVAGEPRTMALADFTQDWHPDLVVAGLSDVFPIDSQIQLYPNIAAPFTWADMGFALAGTLGEPQLTGTGELLAGTPGFVRLTCARPSSLAAVFVAADANAAPFKGGILVPIPPLVVGFLLTDAAGVLTLPWASWPSSQPGATWFFQFGVADVAAPHGVALSNALMGTEPD